MSIGVEFRRILNCVPTQQGPILASVYPMIRDAYDKFPDFFHMGTFIDSTHMKL